MRSDGEVFTFFAGGVQVEALEEVVHLLCFSLSYHARNEGSGRFWSCNCLDWTMASSLVHQRECYVVFEVCLHRIRVSQTSSALRPFFTIKLMIDLECCHPCRRSAPPEHAHSRLSRAVANPAVVLRHRGLLYEAINNHARVIHNRGLTHQTPGSNTRF